MRGDAPGHDAARWLLLQSPIRPGRRWLRPRDSILTLMLGCLSVALGLVAMNATIAAIAGRPLQEWSEWRQVTMSSGGSQQQLDWDPEREQQRWVPTVVVLPGPRVWLPSARCEVLALTGAILGGTGLALGWRRRRVATWSVIGLTLSVLAPFLAMAHAMSQVGLD